MEKLSKLQSKIDSLEELRELMGALRALAASHVQAAQAALEGIREYAGVIETSIAEGVTLLPAGGADLAAGRSSTELLVLISPEHGFVGGLTEHLVEHAAQIAGPDWQLAAIGQRGANLLIERDRPLLWTEPMATQVGAVLGVARRVANRLQTAGRATIIYAGYRRGGNYEVETRQVLPLDPVLLQQAEVRSPPLHHLPAEVLLLRLADEYLIAELTRALMESFASENGARLRVLEAADRNIDSRLAHLDTRAHTLRQAAITAELLDLITGAEAAQDSISQPLAPGPD